MSRARIRLVTAATAAALAVGTLPAAAYASAAPGAGVSARHHQHHLQQQAETIRQIPLQGAVNLRDIGGYRSWTGGQVRQGLVYRSDALSKLTDADVTTVSGLGLTKVVDFRIPMELQYDGADRLPTGLSPLRAPSVTSASTEPSSARSAAAIPSSRSRCSAVAEPRPTCATSTAPS